MRVLRLVDRLRTGWFGRADPAFRRHAGRPGAAFGGSPLLVVLPHGRKYDDTIRQPRESVHSREDRTITVSPC